MKIIPMKVFCRNTERLAPIAIYFIKRRGYPILSHNLILTNLPINDLQTITWLRLVITLHVLFPSLDSMYCAAIIMHVMIDGFFKY